eukprot:Amastigsp_a339904_8.p2 type:complete len:167 gc:universal Amastigsp_a339904_8:559-1059(+)
MQGLGFGRPVPEPVSPGAIAVATGASSLPKRLRATGDLWWTAMRRTTSRVARARECAPKSASAPRVSTRVDTKSSSPESVSRARVFARIARATACAFSTASKPGTRSEASMRNPSNAVAPTLRKSEGAAPRAPLTRTRSTPISAIVTMRQSQRTSGSMYAAGSPIS